MDRIDISIGQFRWIQAAMTALFEISKQDKDLNDAIEYKLISTSSCGIEFCFEMIGSTNDETPIKVHLSPISAEITIKKIIRDGEQEWQATSVVLYSYEKEGSWYYVRKNPKDNWEKQL
jgi:hypothetical protein